MVSLTKGVQEAERALAAIQMIGNGVIKNRALAMTGASKTIMAYLTKLGVASAAELSFAQKLKLTTIALWEQAAAWAATPLGMATIAAAGIFAIVKAVDYFSSAEERAAEEAAKAAEEFNALKDEFNGLLESANGVATEFRNLKQSTEDIIPRFVELAEGVNKLGQNAGLTDEEYAEFLSLNNKIAEMFPELNLGMDNNGNAMLALSYTADTLAESLWEVVEAQRAAANAKIAESMPDALKKAVDIVSGYKGDIAEIARDYDLLIATMQDGEKDDRDFALTKEWPSGHWIEPKEMKQYLELLDKYGIDYEVKHIGNTGLYRDVIIKDIDAAYALLEELKERQTNNLEAYISGTWDDFASVANAWMQTDTLYGEFDDEVQNIAQRMFAGIDFENLGLTTSAAVEAYIRKNIINPLYNAGPQVRSALEQIDEWQKQLKSGEITAEQFGSKVKGAFAGLKNSMPAQEFEQFQKLFVAGFNAFGIVGGDFDAVVSSLIQELSDLKISLTELSVDDILSEETVEEIDNVQSRIKTLSDALAKLSDGSLDVAAVTDLLQEFPELAKYTDLSADNFGNLGDGLRTLIQNSPDALVKSLKELANTNGTTSEAKDLINDLCIALERLANVSAHGPLSEFEKFVDTLSNTDALDSGFSQLSAIFNDINDAGDFDWSSILSDSFVETFGSLGESYEKFIRTVASSPKDLSACRSAFNELATAYIANSGALDNVTESNRDAVVAMLEQMGVTNAAAIVDGQLALGKERLKYASSEYTNMTYDEIQALYNEAMAGSFAKQALAELAVQKYLAENTVIDSTSDIEQLLTLANAANATAESLTRVNEAKAIMAQADSAYAQYQSEYRGGDPNQLASYQRYLALVEEANSILSKPLEYGTISTADIIVDFDGAFKNSKKETWFEKQYKMHQHLVSMEKETDEDYFKWLNRAYQQAYSEGIIELDEYRKYQKEVFDGLRDMFMDSLSDIEHEISMRENYDGEDKKIIELYEELIENVEKEIDAARARGLTDEDDYIQELQKKWQDYTGSIENLRDEITESAKDALDELIDYRIDMLKQEIKDEKDALDKRLDNLKEFYDKQKEMLQDQRDEENYLKDQADKRKTVTDLQAELAMLANDDSAWAQKRKLELQEELATAQEDLDEFEKDHALDLALDALDKAYNDQEAQIQAEMDALEERLNDPEALYNKALEDIRKNSENQLYYQMLMYNRQYGDGNDKTVKDLWESAFGSLSDYEKLFGELYNGVAIENKTGVEDEGGWDDEKISGTNPDNQQLTDDVKKKVAAAIWDGGYGWGTGSTRASRLTEVFGANNGIQALVNKGVGKSGVSLTNEYTYANMRKKFKGYASGTDNATPGWHKLFEGNLDEYVFTSSDGNRYRMFSGLGDKVLNGEATDFLYDFATTGGSVLTKMLADLFKVGGLGNITKPVQAIEVNAGDIIVHGNANERTVSEIRRAQRDNLEFVLKELNRLNK